MNDRKVIPFPPFSREGMARKKIEAKTLLEHSQDMAKAAEQFVEQNKTLQRKSVVLPANVWRALERDAENQRRTPSRQLEVVLMNVYHIGAYEIEPIEKPPTTGFIQHVDLKAS